MRTAFFGTSAFAATVLRRLAGSPHRPTLVVTPPDRKRGRGRRLAAPPVAEQAAELDIALLQTASVNEPEASARILAGAFDLAVVCAFGQLIKEPLISELDLLNVHPSLLPRWRGAAPIERAILAGDERTGVSIMRLTEGLDSGPIALQEEVAIGADENFGGLETRLAALGGDLMVRALDIGDAETLEFREQDEADATYAEKVGPEDRRLDPSRRAVELERAVRALTPQVGAYLEIESETRLGVSAAAVWKPDPEDPGSEQVSLDPGELRGRDGMLLLGCGEGILRLVTVQPPGKRPMAADAYLRGHPEPGHAV